ncbi:hypothetical protein Pla175_37420 [Pirellulimonas nuda]|uniref:DUF4956 domain-containing protein n=1 Tax=Pirellulimonas nuda TaxID=2528009 RepID=A0A518DFU6_9BACT|nr:DUF4956 domain-containing protein [Pirellulimonas nuda]QDU90338.1 hypothetical protein Pla175_37420 [Pirellulimonas nuda]
MTEFLGVPLFDDDFYKLLARFGANLVVLTAIVQFCYFRSSRSKDYLFTYYTVSILVFFLCFTLKKFDLGLGMALGLFAIFGILRYRTDAIPIREMSYLFVVIGIAVINALSNSKMSYAELAFTNGAILAMTGLLESLPLLKQESREEVLYEKIDLVRPENHQQLIDDLQQRTGLVISRIELGKIDFLQDTVAITVYYYAHEQTGIATGEVDVSRRVRRR